MRWLFISCRQAECCNGATQANLTPGKAIDGRQCLIIANRAGSISDSLISELRDRLGNEHWYVVAADGGADLAKEIGLAPNVVVGDMDSLSMEGQRELAEAGCRFITHPVEKDQTDTHLAMQWACGFGFTEISVLMNRSGRLDHVLGIIWAAYGLVEKGVSVRFVDAQFEAVLVKGPASVDIRGPKKLLVSLLPLCDSADGITLNGMKYSLKGESLRPGETRGISNETMDSEARVEVGKGTLLVMVSGSTG